MEKKIVVALGGNALQSGNSEPTAEAQLEVVKNTAKVLAKLIKKGHETVLVHGNGPQIGRMVMASEAASEITPAMPFDVCGAMSQGYIGYHLQQALRKALLSEGIEKDVVTMVTQIEVNASDPAFSNPTKPIGAFYDEKEAENCQKYRGWTMKEDAGRGYRRVVASPKPQKIVELEAVRKMSETAVVITCGGGGIPVLKKSDSSHEGVAAVIDKDFAAELLASNLDADVLMILTEVEHASVNFRKPDERPLKNVSAREVRKYIKEGHFAPGSMLPKVEAACKFVERGGSRRAIITSLESAVEAIDRKTGTQIVR